MKKSILLMITLFVFSRGFSQAQEPQQKQNPIVNIGVRAGVNFSQFIGEGTEDLKFTGGLNIAVPVEFEINNNFSIQPELHYIQKGTGIDIPEEYEVKASYFANYFELPVLFKAKFGTDEITTYLFGAPTFGYALSQYTVASADGDREKDSEDFDSDYQNRFDFGLALGLGFELQAGSGKVVFDARYGIDFTDQNKYIGERPEDIGGVYNSGIALTLGYMVPLGL